MLATLDKEWDALRRVGVSEQTLHIVTNLNGYRREVLADVLYIHTGLRSFDQL